MRARSPHRFYIYHAEWVGFLHSCNQTAPFDEEILMDGGHIALIGFRYMRGMNWILATHATKLPRSMKSSS